nr:NAD(P)H-hydrate epimerase [Solirubrobacterales bacterium]
MESWLSPILDADGMRQADAWTIEQRGVPALELMETAGSALAEAALELAQAAGPIRVVCGKGNNGGDGIVAARHLARLGHQVEVLLLWPAAESSDDSKANLERLGFEALEVSPSEIAASLQGSALVIDAIFGTGFSGAPRSPADAAIEAINACGAPVLAADIPSGVDGSTGEGEGAACRATLTVTFHTAKLGHWIAPGKGLRGELRVAEIGISSDAPVEPSAGLIDDDVLGLPPLRASETTKF